MIILTKVLSIGNMARSYTLLIASAIILATIHRHVTASISAVCVFRREEIDLHKYSAILAAIKPVRGQLDREIKKALSPIDYYFHQMKGKLYWLICLSLLQHHASLKWLDRLFRSLKLCISNFCLFYSLSLDSLFLHIFSHFNGQSFLF